MFRFQNPEFLYLSVLLIGLIILFVYTKLLHKRKLLLFGNPDTIKQLTPSYSVGRKNFKFWVLFSAIGVAIILLARPQFGAKLENIKREGVEIMIALDVSNSMMAEDISPNRLEKSKMILSRLVDMLRDDRIGLVVFAGKSYTQLPITADYVSAKMFFSNLSPSLVTQQGTAIGSAINLCTTSFSENNECEKAIIVITDGENHEDDAIGATKTAAENNIKTHVIGVGTPSGSPIPIQGTSAFLKDSEGNVVVTALNEQMCQEVAQAGGGVYVRADNSLNAVKVLEKTIKEMKKSEINGSVYTAYDEQFQSIAWIVLILLIIEFIVLDRKNPLFKNIRLFAKDKEKNK